MHAFAPLALHVPDGQSVHDVLADAPLNVPLGHVKGSFWPVADA